jgi:hypothetical protein
MIDRNPLPALNRLPVNQAAQRCMAKGQLSPDPNRLHAIELLQLGFQFRLPIPGQAEGYRSDLESAAEQLDSPRLAPADVMRWLLSNPNAGSTEEQSSTLSEELLDAPTWQAGAQRLMQWFYDLKASLEPFYRPAPHLQT